MTLNSGGHITHQSHPRATVTSNHPLWHATTDTPAPCPSLAQSLDVDVAIVGGGYTGLWTTLWLSILDPSIDIAVFERPHLPARLARWGAAAISELLGH